MKSYIYKIFLLFIALFLTQCNDEFLERFPLDEISNETFWNTENDLLVYNNSLYDRARDDNNVPILMAHDDGFDSHRFSYWYLDGFSDNIAPKHPRHDRYQQVRAGKHPAPSGPQWFGYQGWNFVREINVGLANYYNAPLPEATINKYAAEARLFRAWFYADKVQKFGDITWLDKELNTDSEELFGPRTPREEVMANVLEDLNFATQFLPDDWNDGNAPGRLNRWCALLVKSRVCLFEGTWRKYHGGSDVNLWLQEAANAAKELMDNGPYSLYMTGNPTQDYNSFHRVLDPTGNPEVMYWRRYQLGIFTNHVQNYFQYVGGATKSFVEDYLCTDGLPITLSPLYQGDAQIEDVFVNRDPRMRQTILHPEDAAFYKFHNADGRAYPRLEGMAGGRRGTTGYQIIKHYNADDMIGKAFNQGEHPGIILRFGEALLNYAEAQAELGVISQADLDVSINQLRARVGMPPLELANVPVDPRYVGDGVPPIIVEIRRERRIELFLEGFRYNDLRRWKQGKKLEQPDLGFRWDAAAQARYPGATVQTRMVDGIPYIDVYAGTDYANPEFDESKHYLWPIPLDEIAQNPNLGQNPGW